MNLREVMHQYEAAMERTRRTPDGPQPMMTSLKMVPVNGEMVFDLTDAFTLMFWRLYPNGDLASGLDFLTPNVQFGEAHTWYRARYPEIPNNHPHRHNYLEISYVYRGALTQEINGERHTFREGDVWILDRNCLHQEERFGHECFVVFVEIYAEFFDELFAQAFRHNPAGQFIKEALMEKRAENRFIHFCARERDPDVQRIFDYILEERELNRPGSDYVIKGLLISLFALLAANYSFNITAQRQRALNQSLFQQVEAYLRAHYRDVTLEELARVFSFNKNYLGRLIQSAGGLSYKELLQKIRLEAAAQLLADGTQPVNEISAAVGYQNTSYFYRLFKTQYGVTPQRYREKLGMD